MGEATSPAAGGRSPAAPGSLVTPWVPTTVPLPAAGPRYTGSVASPNPRRPDDWWAARLPERQIDYHVRIVTRAGEASGLPLVYVATPKVACTTLKATLWRWHLRDPDCAVEPAAIHRRTDATFRAPRELGFRQFMTDINAAPCVRFCFVRNPYTRLLSCYLNKIVGRNAAGRLRRDGLAFRAKFGYADDDDIPFAAFVDRIASESWYEANPHWRIQTEQLLWGGVHYDFVGRFEAFRGELDRLARERDVDLRPYLIDRRHHATNAHLHVAAFYTPELQARVHDLYRADFDAFGYDDALPPGH